MPPLLDDRLLIAHSCPNCEHRQYQVVPLMAPPQTHACHNCGHPHIHTRARVRVSPSKVPDGPWIVALYEHPHLRERRICWGQGGSLEAACLNLVSAIMQYCGATQP